MLWLKSRAAGAPVGVDREAKQILGYVVAQEGPFKTNGRGEFDEKGLTQVVKLMKGNGSVGTKVRFQHPDMSNDGLGKFLGRAHNPRMDSVKIKGGVLQAVRADLHLAESSFRSPAGDLGSYVMDLAVEDSDALSSSLVLQAEQVYRTERNGARSRDESGKEMPPLWYPTVIHASDIVDTGDAVDGLLSVEDLPESQLWIAAAYLDRSFDGWDCDRIRRKLHDFLESYLSRRFPEEEQQRPNLIANAKSRLRRLRLTRHNIAHRIPGRT
jgi:hypothetical protein